MRRVLLAFLLLAPLSANATSPARARRAEKQLERAVALLHETRVGDAFAAVDRALALDPENVDARYLRALLYVEGAKVTDDRAFATRLQRSARDDFATILQLAPDSEAGKASRAALEGMRGSDLFPIPDAPCSDDARAAMEQAESAWGRGDHVAAEAAYARATGACPGNAAWWTWYGDVYFDQQEYARAGELYRRAIAIEPCFWTAHRFLADAQQRGGDTTGAYGSLLHAVVCNPRYDDAWDDLAAITDGRAERPTFDLAEDPGPVPAAAEATSEEAQARGAGLIYRAALTGSHADTPLARRREAVQATLDWLDAAHLADEPADAHLRAWRVLAKARGDGMLDEGILVLLVDAELVPELQAAQRDHLDRLVTFLGKHVAAGP